ncbi:unnamed protein product [Anisakis simplex]|uniref:MFS domain-containing protein n=1 Tax=Anisakis simplex TaxID=6269 RepID=A0A0M3JX89_ANISI|nr:unnamed protein product [Anisakis simplex]
MTLATDWRSIHVATSIAFITSIQFSMYFSSLWPYLQQMDRSATENFFGIITAVYSLGQALASPLFGFWSVRIGATKIPILTGLVIMFVGNLIYTGIDLVSVNQRYVMLVARFITGLGGGAISVIRSYAIMASSVKDRSKAISENTAFQIGLTFLGYPGWGLHRYRLNMYTAPAFLACFTDLVAIILLLTMFNEQYVSVEKKKNTAGATQGSYINSDSYISFMDSFRDCWKMCSVEFYM